MDTVPAYRSGWDTVYRVPVVKGSEKKINSNKSTPQKKRDNKVYIFNIYVLLID